MTRALVAIAVTLAVAVSGASSALADSHAEAIVLFDQGIKDMKAGRLDKACAELQASLDLARDSGTKGALARCHGLAGRVASAWLLWRELADTAPTTALRTDAAAQAAKLERRLPRYTVKLAGKTPKLVVEINGKAVSVNVPVAVPIDPGTVSVSASGRDGDRVVTETWEHDYTAVEGETLVIEVPALARRPTAVAKPVAPKKPKVDTERADSRHRRHVIALVLGGVALGAAGGGAYFGYEAQSTFDEAKQACNNKLKECPQGQVARSEALVKDARAWALRSDIAFGVAGALAITATVVWITAPSLERKGVVVAPSVGPGSVGLVLGGAF